MEQQQAITPPPDRTSPLGMIDVEQAEAALVEHYPRLVRLAYLVLPPGLGRNRRVLTAHAVTQRALPRHRTAAADTVLPAQRTDGRPAPDPGYAFVRQRVLRAALAAGRPALRFGSRRLPLPQLPPLLPQVWGLRLFPRSGGADELALDQALSALSAPARAAYALRGLEGLGDREVRRILAAAGVAAPREALAEADAAAAPPGSRDGSLLDSGEFDPCSLQARPTDLIRRRQHVRAALAAAVAAAVCGALLALPGDGWGRDDGAAAPPYARNAAAEAALKPAELTRAPGDAWRTAVRTDFSAWPARGGRTHDTALLRRALAAWARPGDRVQVSATPGTPSGPAAGPAQLLYAGEADGAAVVLLYDGLRVVRYAEAADGPGGGAALDFARTDGADAAGAAALVLSRTDDNVRYLTAPWVRSVALADLTGGPEERAAPLHRSADGVTDPVPAPARGSSCTRWPALEMTGHLYTDLGELTPARLTYGAPGRAAEPAGRAARTAWARTACQLPAVRARGVREVNAWEYARQRLPEHGGTAAWLCTRAETWRGPGSRTMAQFQPPVAGDGDGPGTRRYPPGAVAARSEGGRDCGPRSPHALAGVLWKSAAGHWWLVAAGSDEVRGVAAGGGVTGRTKGRLLAVRATAGAHARLTARLPGGGRFTALH
ncbi:hypothetical protein C3486_13055 [Streptomyces sp. Ru73]|uniref:hypothetical protein n=1 Tax=Streptomyces sp. Ru73 TaxID=2080748 RepID=UPI000CDE09F7|nr:hypothetical protein [Streptomyces sp. Ru73]POX40565.1 hypothetical protein C3486_13055 [Streptomyces sp. Ru73]